MGNFFWGELFTSIKNGRNKADFKWQWPGIAIGRFGRIGDLIYCRRNSVEVGLNGRTPSNKIPDVLGCDVSLHLHSPGKKFRILYLVGPQALVLLEGIRNAISQRNKTTCGNTRLGHNLFFKENIIQEIAINESGWNDTIKAFLEYVGVKSGGISPTILKPKRD